jgi:thiamine-monophosphate kinase
MASESELINRTSRKLGAGIGQGLRIGIGDDAAVMRPRKGMEWVVTTDAFLEGVHFLPDLHPPRDAGYKALARASSDLAAMGARPLYFLMNVALPDSRAGKWYGSFLTGMARAARNFGLILAGGDTTIGTQVAIDITVIGEALPGRAVLRSGARPGHLLCVSGRLGEAELGLRVLLQGLQKESQWKKAVRKHFHPEPRLEVGQWLAENGMASAMIDISDGLSTDLAHICEASGVGARVWAADIPKVEAPHKFQEKDLDRLRLALDGGEDYELLFTVPWRFVRRLPLAIDGVSIAIIGEITRERKIRLVDETGKATPLKNQGWDPFRRDSIVK